MNSWRGKDSTGGGCPDGLEPRDGEEHSAAEPKRAARSCAALSHTTDWVSSTAPMPDPSDFNLRPERTLRPASGRSSFSRAPAARLFGPASSLQWTGQPPEKSLFGAAHGRNPGRSAHAPAPGCAAVICTWYMQVFIMIRGLPHPASQGNCASKV